MLTAAEADQRRRDIKAEFARRVEQCQTRYRVDAEAILRARKHLSPLSKIIRARELLRDIYLRETADLTALSAEQAERLRAVDAEAPPLTLVDSATSRPGTSSSGSDTGEWLHSSRMPLAVSDCGICGGLQRVVPGVADVSPCSVRRALALRPSLPESPDIGTRSRRARVPEAPIPA